MKKHKSYLRAFTLAEVLLVMAIAGVIMALLVRIINRVDPDKDKFLFLKSYNAIEKIVSSSINDGYKYDQNIYVDNVEGETHIDFSDAPLDTAKVVYTDVNDKGEPVQKTACPKKAGGELNCDKELTQTNALCYYLAEHINTIGPVNCSSTGEMNFKSSLGVCFWDWDKAKTNGEYVGIIDPSCTVRDNIINTGYAVKVFRRGNVTVPKPQPLDTSLPGNQPKAVEWIKNPTDFQN